MKKEILPADLKGLRIYFIGIKGTGMTALAEIFLTRGAFVKGSDTDEKFYTDKILDSLGIIYSEGFSEANIISEIDFIVHSAAYTVLNNIEMKEAVSRGIPVIGYPEALGQISISGFSCGITGVHGKTSTASLAGSILKGLKLPVTTLVGSGVNAFGGRSSFTGGDKYFVAETCEYKRHFLHFSPNIIILTNIETDHMDYYKDFGDIEDAFIEYINLLPSGGRLIYCSDDKGARNAASKVNRLRPDIRQLPYGRTALSPYRIKVSDTHDGVSLFSLEGFDAEFSLRIPGMHMVLNATAAIALTVSIYEEEGLSPDINGIKRELSSFTGSKRRSEIKGEAWSILFMDDYGHHPTEIKTTLKGLRDFYPDRRIVVDFMSHTYSRTEALFSDFARCFGDADIVVLHKIYSSARETEGRINGRSLYDEAKKYHSNVYYFHEVEDSFSFYTDKLKKNDLFITIGAGDNWRIGESLLKYYREEKSE